MRVATWNVNGLRARLDYVRLWLEARRPDVVGLQELKLTDEQFPHDELAELGYAASSHGQKAWNGVAVLARDEITVLERGLPGQEALGARLLTAEVRGLAFTTVYCPNGKHIEHPDFAAKLSWLQALADHFQARHDPAKDVVLCGDFNICPAAIDSWNEDLLTGSHLPHRCGARVPAPPDGVGIRGPLPGDPPGPPGLLLVGLPRRRLPPRAGPAPGPAVRLGRGRRARHRRRDRPRLAQEAGGSHALGPRSRLRGPRRLRLSSVFVRGSSSGAPERVPGTAAVACQVRTSGRPRV